MINNLKGYLDKGWKTKEKILYFLNNFCDMKIGERELRDEFARFNERYENGEQEMFIAHSNKGYLLTNDERIVLDSLEDDHKRAIKLLKRYYRCKKALSEKNQLSLEQKDADIYEVLMRLGNG